MVKGWETTTIGAEFDLFAGGDVDREHFSQTQTNIYKYPIYANALQKNGLYGFTSNPKYKGDSITITGRGDVGVAMYRATDFDAIVRLLVLTPKLNNKADSRFTTYLIEKCVDFPMESTGVPQLTVPQICDVELFLPPLPEQRRIAAVLSDTDALIAALEKLIAKKRNIKQGAMQELLTGKRRLTGFSGKWVERPLEDFFILTKGKGLSKERTSPLGNNNCILYGELFTTYKEVIQNVVNRTNETEGTLSKIGDILMPLSTTTKGNDLAIASALMLDDVLLGGDIAIFRPYVDVDSRYFSYRICLMHNEIIQYTQGITIIHLRPHEFHKSLFIVPPTKEEQTIIAEIIIDMDTEINTLTAKLTKFKHIKQGMMSELLTGRIRLTEQETEIAPMAKKIELPKQESVTEKPHHGYNEGYEDAVILVALVNLFGTEQHPFTAFDCQKFPYLFHRHLEGVAKGYKKFPGGPYNPSLKYRTARPIALKKNYVRECVSKYKGLVISENAQEALGYFAKWYGDEPLKWLEQFRKIPGRKNELELLTTTDKAMVELRNVGKSITLQAVKDLIKKSPAWKDKLKRPIFSDENIIRAINWSNDLFGQALLQGDNLP
jgi:type I restriction enzyme S subunit